MGHERYPRDDSTGDHYYKHGDDVDNSRDYGSRRDFGYSGAPQRPTYGAYGGDRDPRLGDGDRHYGPQEYGHDRNMPRDRFDNRADGDRGVYGAGRYRSDQRDETNRATGRNRPGGGMDQRDRGFFDRAGDEVRSWFGDEDAERRRELDARRDARYGTNARDEDYHSWRRGQIDALDRDYDEYRAENRTKFENEFGTWRTERQGQRGLLGRVTEHMDVLGSDGQHVGTVDKVRGDRIILAKSDEAAGGRHHSIPSRWLQSVDGNVALRKTAEEAQSHWRDEERNRALFSDSGENNAEFRTDHNLNRSFSGTY
ncbi:MAG: DUF2171 domain-containing protein [Sphingomonas sp.]